MSEHIFRFLLSEITHLRIHCKRCGCTAEIPIEGLAKQQNICAICTGLLGDVPLIDAFAKLGLALTKLKESGLQIEVTLPQP